MEDLATARGVLLGSFELDGRTIEVIERGVHGNLLWLNYLTTEPTRRSLAAIQWTETHTPRATIAVTEIDWVCSGSRRAEEMVSRAMTLYRATRLVESHDDSAGRCFEPGRTGPAAMRVVTIDDFTELPTVVFDSASRPATARGIAAVPLVPQPRKGE